MQQPDTCPLGSRLISDASGFLILETLLVYVPVVAFFFMAWDLGELAAADIALARAADATAREAALVLPADPQLYGGEPVRDRPGMIMSAKGDSAHGGAGMRYRALQQFATHLLAGAAPQFVQPVRLELELVTGTAADVVLVRATLRAAFRCVGGNLTLLVCGMSGQRELSKTASDVVQTARYQYAHSSPTGRSVAAGGLLAAAGG